MLGFFVVRRDKVRVWKMFTLTQEKTCDFLELSIFLNGANRAFCLHLHYDIYQKFLSKRISLANLKSQCSFSTVLKSRLAATPRSC